MEEANGEGICAGWFGQESCTLLIKVDYWNQSDCH